MRRLALATALFVALAASAQAEENPACAKFKWPLAPEKSWFEAGALEALASCATVATLAEGAFTVKLVPKERFGGGVKVARQDRQTGESPECWQSGFVPQMTWRRHAWGGKAMPCRPRRFVIFSWI
jgi:hypothetical protein